MSRKFIPLSRLLSAGRPADHAVCHTGRRCVRWLEFSQRVGGLAYALERREEKRWVIHAEDPLDFAVGLLAAMHAHKHAVIPPNFQPGTLAALGPAYEAILGAGPEATLDATKITPQVRAFEQLAPRQASFELYTSGSSGEPKRVPKSLAQLDAEAQVLESCWGATLDDAVIVATVAHHHIYGMLFRLVWPLAAGRAFDATLCAEPQTLLERLAHVGRAAIVSSPAHLTRLPDLIDLESLDSTARCIFSSGGPLPGSAALEFAHRLGRAPTEIYGSTETGGIAWRVQADRPDGAYWTPFPGITVRVDDDGALCLRSPYLVEPGWMTSDDGAEQFSDGRFLLTGRLDRVAKIEGKRISLPQMEQRLREHPWISEACVVPLDGRKETLGAVVVLRAAVRTQLKNDGRYRIAETLRGFLRDWFEPVLIPRRWRFLDQLPANDRGKTTAAALARVFDLPSQPLLPDIRGERRDTDRVELELHVPPDLVHFEGHFPGYPILPGVVQIDWAMRFARTLLPCRGEFSAMENIRFQSIVRPGMQLSLTLMLKDAGTRIAFAYSAGGRKCSSGTIVLHAS